MADYSIRMARMKYADVDKIYQTIPLDTIPWNSETPPDELVNLVKDGKVHLQAGAGILADSDPAAEWDETMNKGRALWLAVQRAERGTR